MLLPPPPIFLSLPLLSLPKIFCIWLRTAPKRVSKLIKIKNGKGTALHLPANKHNNASRQSSVFTELWVIQFNKGTEDKYGSGK